MNIAKTGEQETTSNCDTMTKGSTSPKKNERYSKVFQNDDDVDEINMAQFQKALSMPINFTKA